MTSAPAPVTAIRGSAAVAPARHAPDVPGVAVAGRHDGRMIALQPAEQPAVAHPWGTP